MHRGRINPFIISIQRHSARKNAIFCLICINVDAERQETPAKPADRQCAYVAVLQEVGTASFIMHLL